MIETILGRRYERLLLLSAPLTLVAIVVLFVVIAVDSQKDRVRARCLETAADALAENLALLQKTWDEVKPAKPATKDYYWGGTYKRAIERTWIYGLHAGTDCYRTMDAETDARYRSSPTELIAKLREEAKVLSSAPLEYLGIELPDKATINIFGTSIKIGVLTFVQVLQFVLAPLLILWTGSLYNTRYRETRLIGAAESLTQVFPHSINIYPSGQFQPLRKKNWLLAHQHHVISSLYCLTRIALLLVFVGPPVVLYALSLYFLNSERLLILFVGLTVVGFSLAPVLIEAMPWHFWKVFPPPSEGRQASTNL